MAVKWSKSLRISMLAIGGAIAASMSGRGGGGGAGEEDGVILMVISQSFMRNAIQLH